MPVVAITPQLRTTDLDRSILFYTQKVGLELEFRHADFYAGIRSPGGGSFHLKLVDAADPSIAFVQEGGHLHLYLGVDDVDAFAEQLRAAGVDLAQPPCNTAWGTRELVFNDDQGHTIYAGMRVPSP